MDRCSSSPLRGRILYIEDSRSNLLLIQGWAAQFPDLQLLTAETGEDGLTAFQEAQPDAVLLDLSLPDMPGIEVLRQIRAMPGGRMVPIAVLTGHTAAEHVQDAIRGGAMAYWTKPVDLARLAHDLGELMLHKRAADGTSS